MKKGIRWLSFIMVIIFVLNGCSSKDKTMKVTVESKPYLVEYDKSLQKTISEMNEILLVFNDTLNGIYTLEYSKEQFAQVNTKNIKKSNELIEKIEAMNVQTDLFETHQNLILLANQAHQLLLDSVGMANAEGQEIQRDTLRTQYLEIKTRQAQFVNEWKILMEQLKNTGTTK